MNVYQDKQGKERRVSTMADRRRAKTDILLRNGAPGCIPCIDRGAPLGSRIGVADRRANTTEPPNPSDTAELLKKYRAALITAYELGKQVKEVYDIVPPKAIIDWDGPTVTIGLQVN